MKNYALFLVFVFVVGACSKDDSAVQATDKAIIGIWINPEYNNDGTILASRANEFQDDASGFEFKENGNYIERANSGWCATPPISYSNYEGYWEEETDNNFLIDVAYWGGRQTYNLEVISVSSTEIVYKQMY